ncbi:hypothetical protein GYMLUDRAFT_235936 [Collybiopsis luxurians FD-317 M1]|nr:hypothetical protein GYMLUDRAFT_235936 [Collybiopsis luxurians FD-317 M1]
MTPFKVSSIWIHPNIFTGGPSSTADIRPRPWSPYDVRYRHTSETLLGTYNGTRNFQVIAPLFKLPVHSSTDVGDCAPHSSPSQSTLIRAALTGRQQARPAPRHLTPIVEGRKLGKEVKVGCVSPSTLVYKPIFACIFSRTTSIVHPENVPTHLNVRNTVWLSVREPDIVVELSRRYMGLGPEDVA